MPSSHVPTQISHMLVILSSSGQRDMLSMGQLRKTATCRFWPCRTGQICTKMQLKCIQTLSDVQDETAYSHSNQILYRQCIHSLHQKAARQQQKRVYLTGPRGCGKSIALTSLVDWARSQGWLVCPAQNRKMPAPNAGVNQKLEAGSRQQSSFANFTMQHCHDQHN